MTEKLNQQISIKKWQLYMGTLLMIATILGFIGKTVYSAATVEQRMFDTPEQKQLVLKEVESNTTHRNDDNIHMPFQRKMETFVYKPQYDKDRDEMNQKLDRIIEYLINKK